MGTEVEVESAQESINSSSRTMRERGVRMLLKLSIAIGFSAALSPLFAAWSATGEDMAARTGAVSIGQAAPAATLDTVDGKSIELGDFYGRKPVYLKFWATWCVPCQQQMPHFEESWQRYGKSIAVVAVRTFVDFSTRHSFPCRLPSTAVANLRLALVSW
jgi:thiol-disulfide isomerase/thioredoxin